MIPGRKQPVPLAIVPDRVILLDKIGAIAPINFAKKSSMKWSMKIGNTKLPAIAKKLRLSGHLRLEFYCRKVRYPKADDAAEQN